MSSQVNDSDLVREEVKLPTSCRDKSPVGEEKKEERSAVVRVGGRYIISER